MKKHIIMILLVFFAISSLAISRQSAEAGIVSPESCEDDLFSDREQRLCNKYCEKLECDEVIPDEQRLKRLLCHFLEFIFIRKTGFEPPCDEATECAHSPLEANGPLETTCDPIVECVCVPLGVGLCCVTAWSEECACAYECLSGFDPLECAGPEVRGECADVCGIPQDSAD